VNRSFLILVGQSSVVRLASAVVLFVLSIVLARTLGPQGFGSYSFSFSLISLAVLLAQLGFPDLTVREVSKLIELRRPGLLAGYIQHATWAVFTLGLVVVAVMSLALLLLGDTEVFNWQVILAGLPLVVLLPLMAQSAAVLRGTNRVVQSLLGQQLYRPILLLLLVWGGLVMELPITAVTVMALHVLACAMVLIELRRLTSRALLPSLNSFSPVSRRRRVAWTGTAVMFSGVAVVRLINTKFDIFAIGLLMTDTDVGLYAVGVQLSLMAAAMLMITSGVVQPVISRASAAGNDAEVERQCRKSALLSIGAALFALVLLGMLGKWMIGLTYGYHYVGVWPALMVLLSGQVVNAFFGPVGLLLNMRGQERTTFAVTFVASLANIGLNLLLIPSYGLVGAALATVAAMVLWNVLLWHRAWRMWGINSSALKWPMDRKSTA
jgi:O-antigen/teichoic acid export membrane protein